MGPLHASDLTGVVGGDGSGQLWEPHRTVIQRWRGLVHQRGGNLCLNAHGRPVLATPEHPLPVAGRRTTGRRLTRHTIGEDTARILLLSGCS
jgi:hypothetical protein